MKVLVSDAYSPTNVGDGELVRLTIETVRGRFGVEPVVLCTDKQGFEQDESFAGTLFAFKPLSRVRWRNSSGRERFSMLAKDTAGLGLALLASFIPLRKAWRRSFLNRLGLILRSDWLIQLASSDGVVGVGGGYLGDSYHRESLVTLTLYKCATSLGARVETMPLSISSARSRTLRFALRVFGRKVRWRSREDTTHGILSALDLNSERVPDLAWLNALRDHSSVRRETAITIAPVGSDFYGAKVTEPKVWQHIRDNISRLPAGSRVDLIAMHYWDDRLEDGRDDHECERVAALIRGENSELEVKVLELRSYEEVIKQMAGSKFAVCERLHAALAGLATGTQTKVIGYEPKHRGVLELAGLDSLVVDSIDTILESVPSEYILSQGNIQAMRTKTSVMEH